MVKKSKVVFKFYNTSKVTMQPPSLEELIPVRVVNEVIKSITPELLEKAYKVGGISSYHPKMLLKIPV